jgi:hypothetical protein
MSARSDYRMLSESIRDASAVLRSPSSDPPRTGRITTTHIVNATTNWFARAFKPHVSARC